MHYTDRIKELRADHDISQLRLSKELGIPQTTYSDYEKGKVKMPIEILIKLAEYYNVDMNYISGVSNRKESFPIK